MIDRHGRIHEIFVFRLPFIMALHTHTFMGIVRAVVFVVDTWTGRRSSSLLQGRWTLGDVHHIVGHNDARDSWGPVRWCTDMGSAWEELFSIVFLAVEGALLVYDVEDRVVEMISNTGLIVLVDGRHWTVQWAWLCFRDWYYHCWYCWWRMSKVSGHFIKKVNCNE